MIGVKKFNCQSFSSSMSKNRTKIRIIDDQEKPSLKVRAKNCKKKTAKKTAN